MKFGIGQPVTRKEDDALLRGAGPLCRRSCAAGLPACGGAALAACACALSHRRRRQGARDAGRALVLTGADTAELGHLPCQGEVPDTTIDVPPYPVLARDEVRHVGDAVAFVVADTVERAQGRRRGDRDRLGAAAACDRRRRGARAGRAAGVAEARAAISRSRPTLGDARATARRLRRSRAHAVSLDAGQSAAGRQLSRHPRRRRRIRRARRTASRSRCRARAATSCATCCATDVLKIPPDKMRVVTPDVGGGFGTKLFPYREYALAAVAAQRARAAGEMGRRPQRAFPRRHAGPRQHHHARGSRSTRTGASSRSTSISSPTWAPISRASRRSFPFIGAGMSPGVYDIPACHVRVRGAYTNTVPVDAYRGAGRPEAAYVIERLVDARGARARHRARRAAAAELHQAEARCRTRPRPARPTIPAISPPISRARRSSPTGQASRGALRASQEGRAAARHRRSRPTSRPAATTARTPPRVRLDARRRDHRADRHAIDRAGPPHRLCADRRRASRRCRPSACA